MPDDPLLVVRPDCAATNRVPVERLDGAPKCGRCKAASFQARPVEVDAAAFGRHVASGAVPALAGRFGIRSIPAVILFDQGREHARISGAMDRGNIVAWTRQQIGQ